MSWVCSVCCAKLYLCELKSYWLACFDVGTFGYRCVMDLEKYVRILARLWLCVQAEYENTLMHVFSWWHSWLQVLHVFWKGGTWILALYTCMTRGFKTYIYPNRHLPFWGKTPLNKNFMWFHTQFYPLNKIFFVGTGFV